VTDHITHQAFEEQFPRLILSARDLPKKAVPFNVLLISAVIRLDPERSYDEAEVNAELQRWILEFGQDLPLGHVELRRFLVDAGYLMRDKAGLSYRVQAGSGIFTFDASLRELDLVALVADAKAKREAQRRAYTKSQDS
jgi:hypothetical protein